MSTKQDGKQDGDAKDRLAVDPLMTEEMMMDGTGSDHDDVCGRFTEILSTLDAALRASWS